VILVLDTETTGLLKAGTRDFVEAPGICQIGALVMQPMGDDQWEAWETVRSLDLLINPEKPNWEDDAIKTHGITPEKVKDAPTFFEAFDQIAEIARGCTYWAGYNIDFDRDILAFQLQRYGFERSFPWPRHTYDVLKVAAKKLDMQGKRGQKWPTLQEAYEGVFGEQFSGAHNAFADVQATARLVQHWWGK
jgi:DNA polymerase-3 subunit epsilon